jgi:hypothetical protein
MPFMKAFISKVLLELNGFNQEVIAKLLVRDQFILILLSLWGLIGTVLSSFSVAYIVDYATDSTLSGIICFFISFFVLTSLHVLLVTSSGMELSIKSQNRLNWRPSNFRPLSYFMVGVLFSQPIVLTYLSMTQQLESAVSIQHLNLQVDSIKKRYASYAELKKLQLLQLQTYRNIADMNGPDVTSMYVKKALLIDDGDASETLKELKESLITLGFDVSLISKVFETNLDIEIKNYYEKINPGDISIFVYRGPSKITSDHSLEMTQAKAGLFSHSVDADSLISIISNKKVLASYFLFSLSPDIEKIKENKSINWESHENTYVASLGNDVYGDLIKTFTKNLSNAVELNSVASSTASKLIASDSTLQLLQTTPAKLPVFLTWSKNLFFKDMNKLEMEALIPVKDSCRTYTIFEQNTFAKCLEAEEIIVKSELQFINDMQDKNIQSIEVVKAKKLKSPSIVMNYSGWVVKHFSLAIFYSLFAIVIVVGAFIIRDQYKTGSINRYEAKRVQLSRIYLHNEFKTYRNVLRKVIKRFVNNGEPFDEVSIQHPLYKPYSKDREQKADVDGDDLYKMLAEALKNNMRSTS